jgi:glycine hydroxymethyltransferase
MNQTSEKIMELLRAHEAYRASTLNLIASENVLSPAVRRALDSDLLGRYADYPGRDPSARRYNGNRYVSDLEGAVASIARSAFGARFVELRPLSGHVAGAAVVMGICEPGGLVIELDREGGGHREAARLSKVRGISLRTMALPFDGLRYNVDLDAALRLIDETSPSLVILGSSNFLHPHPVRSIADALARGSGGVLAYDASHVMGFLAAGRFQDPLAEGADIVFGSTHKTLPGPQGGIIYTNREDLLDPLTTALVPGLVTNHHPFRMPGLGLALLEMERWGEEYCDAIVANSNALGAASEAEGLRVVSVDGSFSESHTLLLAVEPLGAQEAADRLERVGIITTHATLPEVWGTEGIRVGTQEVTRRGATEETMARIARLVADALGERRSEAFVADDVAALVATFGPLGFTWPYEGSDVAPGMSTKPPTGRE